MFQLEDPYRLFDYSINVNDVIQLMVRTDLAESKTPETSESKITKDLKIETPTPSCSSATSSTSDEVNIVL